MQTINTYSFRTKEQSLEFIKQLPENVKTEGPFVRGPMFEIDVYGSAKALKEMQRKLENS